MSEEKLLSFLRRNIDELGEIYSLVHDFDLRTNHPRGLELLKIINEIAGEYNAALESLFKEHPELKMKVEPMSDDLPIIHAIPPEVCEIKVYVTCPCCKTDLTYTVVLKKGFFAGLKEYFPLGEVEKVEFMDRDGKKIGEFKL